MDKISEVNELRNIYCEMDTESRRKMAVAATELLNVQTALKNSLYVTERSNQRERIPLFSGIPGYIITSFLILFVAITFWVTMINPALLISDITPPVMVRIIITALFGIFCIGAGFVRFFQQKFEIYWTLLAICAGVLCVIPTILTDFIGIFFAMLIIGMQIIMGKREKAVIAE